MRRILWVLINTGLLSFLMVGCSNSNVKEAVKELTINDIWHAPGYGITASLSNEKIALYQSTSEYCQSWELEISYQDFVNSSEMSDDLQSIVVTFDNAKQPGMVMQRQKSLPASCSNGVIAKRGDSGYQFNPQLDFDIFWQTFNEYYAFFHIEDVDWAALYSEADQVIDESTTEEELFSVLAALIEPLLDFHVSLENENLDEDFSVNRKPDLSDIALDEFIELFEITEPYTQEDADAFADYYQQQLDTVSEIILGYFDNVNDLKLNESENMVWGVLPDNIGYLSMETMEAEELGLESNSVQQNTLLIQADLNKVFSDFANVNGIIIDVRTNGGGDDFVGRMVVSHLIESDLHVYSKQARLGTGRTELQRVITKPASSNRFTGPVAMLTSASTSSAAETFAMAIKARTNSQLIGEDSAGGLSDILPLSLPHGLNYSLSNEFYLSVNGDEWEGAGVPVDQQQPFFTLEQRQNQQDLGLSAAIDWVNSSQ